MRLAASLFLASAVCFGQPGPQRPAPPSNCAADGSVVNALTGEPLPRARIIAFGVVSSIGVADSAGRWTLTNITCGRLQLSVSRPGFLTAGPGRGFAGQASATTTPDSPAHDVRLELTPQAVITGRVIDEAGDPVPSAAITVFSSRVLEGKRAFQPGPMSSANDLGEYRIAGLSAGKIILCAHAPLDFQALEMSEGTVSGESCYPGPVDGGAASALSLPAGREARVDFNLSRVPAVSIRGKVTGMPERGNVSLMVQPRTGMRIAGQGRNAVMQRDGTFEARDVTAGSWMLSVDYWEGGKRLLAHTPVDVGAGDIDGVVVHLESAFSISGTVRVESQSGQAANPQQINVNLRGTDVRQGGPAAQWDKNRTSFTMNEAIPDSYMLNVNVPAPFYVKSATLGGRDMLREAIPITQSGGSIEVVLRDDAGSVQGRVEDSNGDAVAGVVMVLQEGRLVTLAMAGPDGHFKIGGLAPGDYRVYAWDDSQQVEYADPDWMRRNGGSGVTASVTAGQAVDVKLVRVRVPVD